MSAGVEMATLSGRFFRAVLPDRAAEVLASPAPQSAGRYHAPGEAVLYMSPRAEWARIAVSGYMREDLQERAIIELSLDHARVVDQRDPVVCSALGIDPNRSDQPWRSALAAGLTPPSWEAAARARAAGADGLIDRSRHIPDGWHLVLFRWNVRGAPTVRVQGQITTASPRTYGPKWG